MALRYYAYQGFHDINPISHLHNEFEIYISLNSKGKFFLQDVEYPLKIGSLFIIKPFDIHHCFDNIKEETTRYVVRFSSEEMTRLSTKSSNLQAIINAAPRNILMTQDELKEVSNIMTALLRSPDQWGMDIANNIKLDEFILTIGMILRAHPINKKQVLTPDHQLIDNVIRYLHAHYQEDVSIEDICKHLYISRTSLCKTFKEHTGFTINHYLTMYRLQVACALLQKGQRVNEVGKAVGFKTYTHFIRTFTNKLGHSPTKFVKEIQNQLNG